MRSDVSPTFNYHPLPLSAKNYKFLPVALGKTKEHPARSCKDLRSHSDGILNSGRYWLSPKDNGLPFIGYCDMDNERGGWTLAYSYTFTNFHKFRGSDNTVTPVPSWMKASKITSRIGVVSTRAPQGTNRDEIIA